MIPRKNNYRKHKNIGNIFDLSTDKKLFGLWIYLMSDCIFFATIFAVYAIMFNSMEIHLNFFNLKFVFCETTLLLLSALTYGMFSISIEYKKILFVYLFFLITFFLGFSFLYMEFYEFYNLIKKGFSPQSNGFLSAFFTLIGIHGFHVLIGLFWMFGIIFQIFQSGLTLKSYVRALCLGLFWHFLDIIWICVFTIVYLIGSIK
ncbi:cytochrome c oxidase subunit 3 [Buchnera aphidicola]|uniref:cytochrome c oxidase subunit 3 n=1 Tax=Buchnera aphidicola TaxID=9 RepID=UPI003464652A